MTRSPRNEHEKELVVRREGVFKPTKAELAAAIHLTVPNLIADGLDVLFCGINPGLYTAAIGHHFGRPGNRFWPALHGAGFTPHVFSPWQEHDLLGLGIGITNMVERTSATAAEVSPEEFVRGSQRLSAAVMQHRPRVVAFLGIGAYRSGFGRPKALLGLQTEQIGESALWVLPSPSGLNANHQLADLVGLFAELRAWVNLKPKLP